MATCTLDDCDRELNRDGVCFYHKMRTIRFGTAQLSRERKGQGWGINPEAGTRENVRAMYEDRRAKGLPDPEPANSEAAKFAIPRGVVR